LLFSRGTQTVSFIIGENAQSKYQAFVDLTITAAVVLTIQPVDFRISLTVTT